MTQSMRAIGGIVLLCGPWAQASPGPDAATQPVTPANNDDLCAVVEAPPNMACIPAGEAIIGSDNHSPVERPAHQVSIPTFFIDRHEVTNAEYRACEVAGYCPRRGPLPKSYAPFLADDQPATPIRWRMAHRYCVWAGKRLPSEAEWEKVARAGGEGRLYPWGEEKPTCERAHFAACKPRATRKVGSQAAGPYGVFDLAGNGYEWVKDWATPCYAGCPKACGPECLGDNPQGPCAGVPQCRGRTKRLLKGGSWFWPAEHLRGSWRRGQRPQSGINRLSFRCASSSPVLTTLPPQQLLSPPERPKDPTTPTASELAAFGAVRDDPGIEEVRTCSQIGTAGHDCRDPMTYYKSNERFQGAWLPYIENIGGGYVGIGADQNYSLIAAARSRWAWIFDYDPEVVRIHYIIRALCTAHPSREGFAAAWRKKNLAATIVLIRDSLAHEPEQIRPTVAVLRAYRAKLLYHARDSQKERKKHPGFGWLANPERYQYIRTLFAQGRIQLRKGNLLTAVVMPDIAKSARALGVPIRVFYSSNADEQWLLTEQYRQNLIGLPFDHKSVVLRTLTHGRWHDPELSKWHYVVHAGLHMQRKLVYGRTKWVVNFMEDHLPSDIAYLSTIRLPGVPGAPLEVSQRQAAGADSQASN